ncbi:hypothetical protein GCK32_022819 [Trichostrongylus colubriformis]|uniref:Uncharacterized protein n=1 Tax=Trichostrongylus colubriformis TaxID=6319 RepID=A0AAN8F957_TRICO
MYMQEEVQVLLEWIPAEKAPAGDTEAVANTKATLELASAVPSSGLAKSSTSSTSSTPTFTKSYIGEQFQFSTALLHLLTLVLEFLPADVGAQINVISTIT